MFSDAARHGRHTEETWKTLAIYLNWVASTVFGCATALLYSLYMRPLISAWVRNVHVTEYYTIDEH